jgi:uncharacterized protein (TIGR03067 family)
MQKTKLAILLAGALCLGAGGDQPDKKELAKFEGTWSLKELTYDGTDHSKLKFKIVFKGTEGSVKGNASIENEYSKIKFKIDPKASPRHFDITISGGSQTDATMKGIYEFKDDDLHICAKVFGNERPKEFSAPDGSSTVFLILKRDPK